MILRIPSETRGRFPRLRVAPRGEETLDLRLGARGGGGIRARVTRPDFLVSLLWAKSERKGGWVGSRASGFVGGAPFG